MLAVLAALLFAVTPAHADPGSLDPSFGTGGVARLPLVGAGPGTARDAAVQADGKVVTVGRTDTGDFAVSRWLADGTLDPSFSGDGLMTLSFGADDVPSAVAVAPDGSIVVAGRSGCRPVIARVTTAGVVDPTFSAAHLGWSCMPIEALAVQSDGRVVLAVGDHDHWAVQRLLTSGAPDLSFAGGRLAVAWAYAVGETVRAMALGPDG